MGKGPKCTAVPRLAFDAECAAVLLDDAVRHAQAEARALADFFRGEEGLEDAFVGRAIHAAAIIRHAHVGARTFAGVADADVDVHTATIVASVDPVYDQVRDYLLELDTVPGASTSSVAGTFTWMLRRAASGITIRWMARAMLARSAAAIFGSRRRANPSAVG
jgi:hypothetical protein